MSFSSYAAGKMAQHRSVPGLFILQEFKKITTVLQKKFNCVVVALTVDFVTVLRLSLYEIIAIYPGTEGIYD